MTKRSVGSQIVDSRPLKVKNRPDLLMCKWCATYLWKALDEGYNFTLDLILIEGFHTKLWAPKLQESQFKEFPKFELGSFGTKWHLSAGPMARHREYYKREGDGFPQVWVVMSLLNLCLPMLSLCIKSVPTTH